MNKNFNWFLVFLLVVGVVYYTLQEVQAQGNAIYNNTIDGVVVLRTIKQQNKDVKIGTGTAFFVGENLLLTSDHVVSPDPEIPTFLFTRNNADPYIINVIGRSADHDLALIKIEDWDTFKKNEKWKILNIAKTDAEIGDDLYTIGHPWGIEWSFSRGIVSNKYQKSKIKKVMADQVDTKIYPGNSGGPALNSKGDIVGLTALMLSGEGGSFGYIIPTEYLKKAIHDFSKYGQIKNLSFGIQVTHKDHKLIVTDLLKNGSAEVCGLQKDDALLKIKTPVRNEYTKIDDFNKLLSMLYELNMDQRQIVLEIERNNNKLLKVCELEYEH